MHRCISFTLAALAAGIAVAQEARPPDPVEPKAKVPPAEYRSAFADYKPFTEQEPAGWREANDEVGAAGGHAGHRPGQAPGAQPSKPQPGAPESSDRPASQGGEHGGHHQ